MKYSEREKYKSEWLSMLTLSVMDRILDLQKNTWFIPQWTKSTVI